MSCNWELKNLYQNVIHQKDYYTKKSEEGEIAKNLEFRCYVKLYKIYIFTNNIES